MRALVTGGNGHLGQALVALLLARGHAVRATVRGLADAGKTAPLRALGAVELFEADVRDRAALEAALDGVDTLFHTAAVYSITAATGRAAAADVVDSAVAGTDAALRAAAARGVRRVVMTSSVVALPFRRADEPRATEADWNTDLRVPYYRAKVESEQLAWRLASELGLTLATILPAGILGPGFARPTPTVDLVTACAMGEFRLGAPRGNFGFVDVRDTAEAHLLAAERGATGRFIVAYDEIPSFDAIVRAIARIDPRVKPPLLVLPTFAAPMLPFVDALFHALIGTPRIATPELIASSVSGRLFHFAVDRARRELGWAPRIPFEQSLRETLQHSGRIAAR